MFTISNRGLINNSNNVSIQQQEGKQDRTFSVNFLSSEMCRKAPFEVIEQLENRQKKQDNVGICYNRLCDLLHKEMAKCGLVKRIILLRKHYRTNQSYWNN